MRRSRVLSVLLLCIACIGGIVRGYRMITYTGNSAMLFPYPQEMIKVSIFSNYAILGWIIVTLIGVFSFFAMLATIYRVRNYPYMIIMEAIFISFLTVMHLIVTVLSPIHLIILPMCVVMLALGIIQTPKEF